LHRLKERHAQEGRSSQKVVTVMIPLNGQTQPLTAHLLPGEGHGEERIIHGAS